MENPYFSKMLKATFLAALILSCTCVSLQANPVDTNTVKQVAKNLFYERSQTVNSASELSANIIKSVKRNDTALYHVVEINQYGHALISADNSIYPVLSYNYNTYPEGALPPAYTEWLAHVERQILFMIRNQIAPEKNTTSEWSYYSNSQKINKTQVKAVSPLLNATWGQGPPYNKDCPYSSSSMYNNNHVPVGCVAVAMGQIMHYWGHPTTGTGSHSYTSNYGTESANYGNTTYNWSNMPNTVTTSSPSSQQDDIAELLYHCGVSVDMNYGDNGSGASSSSAEYALVNYFKYKSSMSLEYKSSTSNWDSKIKTNLDNGRPVYYRGQKSSGGGHAFVLDGYQGSNNDHYHFNWGWGNYFNNYCYLSSLTPANTSYNYSYNQGAIFDIEPTGSGPSGPTIAFDSKTIDDDNMDQSSGNGNSKAEPGETIELLVDLKNTGSSTAYGVNATLSTNDPDINITDGSEDFGDITTGGTATCLYDYDFDVSSSCSTKDVTFTLNITDNNNNSWTETFIVHIYGSGGTSPQIVFESGVIDDDNSGGSSGNDDGYADAGETIELLLELKNTGGSKAYGVTGTLSTSDPDLTITDANENYGDIDVQGTAWPEYDFDLEISSSCPSKDADITLDISDNNGNSWTEQLILSIYGTGGNQCSGQIDLTSTSGTFSDGSGGSDYQNDADCRWLIKPSGASSVKLEFTEFDTEEYFDYVRVYDGNSTSDNMIGKFTGSSLPSDVYSSGGKMLVVFQSDASNTADGFTANYSATTSINQNISENNLTIYPNPNQGTFQLKINTPVKQELALKITNMQGQIVYRDRIEKNRGQLTNKEINLHNAGSGLYHLQIIGKNFQTRKKIIIQ